MSPFFLIDVAALSRNTHVSRDSLKETVPTTMIETLVRLLTSLFH